MKIKQEPTGIESFAAPKSNLIYVLRQVNGCTAEKVDSCIFNDAGNEHSVTANENVRNGNLQVNNNEAVTSGSLASQVVPVVTTASHTSSLPASENWPGQYEFTVSFSPQNNYTKGVAWTYSEIKDKLYVGKDVPCPINFSVNSVMPPGDVTVRVMALYSTPEQVSEVVRRCVNHSMEEINLGRPEAEHLIRCESSTAGYHTDVGTGRHSVVVPFENPAVGQKYSTYIYKFACFGSCSGGPNRRPLMLIFTLESGNQVIGRRKLDVKICACPGRDRKTDEAQCMPADEVPRATPVKRKAEGELISLSEVMEFSKDVYLPKPKKSKFTPDENGFYTISVENKECYEFLRQMQKLYDISKHMKSMSPDFVARTKHMPSNK